MKTYCRIESNMHFFFLKHIINKVFELTSTIINVNNQYFDERTQYYITMVSGSGKFHSEAASVVFIVIEHYELRQDSFCL